MPRAPKSISSGQPFSEKVISEKRKRGILNEQGEEFVGVRNPGRPDGRFIDSIASKDHGPDTDDEALVTKKPKLKHFSSPEEYAEFLARLWDPLKPHTQPSSFSGVNRRE